MSVVKLRKRLIEVEAIRWTGDNETDVVEFTGRSNFNALDDDDHEHADDPEWTAQVFDHLHSTWVGVYTGQWIIKGIKGEFYPCADDVLRETYDEVPRFAEGGTVTVEIKVPSVLTEEALQKVARDTIERMKRSGRWPL